MTPATLPGVANGPRKTPAHTLTIPDETYRAIEQEAKKRGVSVSRKVSAILAEWVAQQDETGSPAGTGVNKVLDQDT